VVYEYTASNANAAGTPIGPVGDQQGRARSTGRIARRAVDRVPVRRAATGVPEVVDVV